MNIFQSNFNVVNATREHELLSYRKDWLNVDVNFILYKFGPFKRTINGKLIKLVVVIPGCHFEC